MSIRINAFALILFVFLTATSVAYASAANIYIAQAASSSSNGSSCGSAFPISFFNNPSNWGSTSTQIGPGTTVHLCGTFTAPAGSSGFLSFQGSGSSGNPVTLVAEPGVVIQAPYWGLNGAINANGATWVTMDGQNNGTIQATSNGTSLANQGPANCTDDACGTGINIASCDNCTVKNWIVSNMYVNIAPNDESGAGQGSVGIYVVSGNNVTISGNTVHDAKWCIKTGFEGGTTSQNLTIASNTGYHCDHGIAVFSDNSGAILNNLVVTGNTMHDGANWDDNANGNHHDGIHVSPTHPSTQINNIQVSNNYIYGDWGANCNTMLYMEANPGKITGASVVNNVFVNSSQSNVCANGLLQDFMNTNTLIANNTLIGSTNSSGIGIVDEEVSPSRSNVKNNILANFENGIYVFQGGSLPSSDYNDFSNVANIAFVWGTSCCTSLAEWKTQAGTPDLHSITASPSLSSTFVPQSGSPVIGAGVNLASLGVVSLLTDKAGLTRSTSAAWDIGAFQNGSSGVGGGTGGSPIISLALAPLTASLGPSGMQQFTATVTNSSAGVTWSLNPAVGSVSAAGMYTAPSSITAAQTVQVIATAVGDTSKSVSATVTLTPPASTALISVAVIPNVATVAAGTNQQFVAAVTGSSTGVKWSLSPQTGSISSTGMYSAPSSVIGQQTVRVTATSTADTSKSGTAAVTVSAPAATCTATFSGSKATISGPGGATITLTLNKQATGTASWKSTSAACP